MSMTKRYLHLVEMDTNKVTRTYTWEEYDEIAGAQDDPFAGQYPSSLITGGKSQQQERTEATHASTDTTLQGGTK
jgi:hypothetical protein